MPWLGSEHNVPRNDTVTVGPKDWIDGNGNMRVEDVVRFDDGRVE